MDAAELVRGHGRRDLLLGKSHCVLHECHRVDKLLGVVLVVHRQKFDIDLFHIELLKCLMEFADGELTTS